MHFEEECKLVTAFLRMQLHHDSPSLAGRSFTVVEAMTAIMPTSGAGHAVAFGRGGFHFPGTVVRSFMKGKFNNLEAEEIALLKALQSHVGQRQDFLEYESWYVVGTFGEQGPDERDLRHVCAHALYYMDPMYRTFSKRIARTLLGRGDIEAYIGTNHSPGVLLEEIQAQLSSGSEQLEEKVDLTPYAVNEVALRIAFESRWNAVS